MVVESGDLVDDVCEVLDNFVGFNGDTSNNDYNWKSLSQAVYFSNNDTYLVDSVWCVIYYKKLVNPYTTNQSVII